MMIINHSMLLRDILILIFVALTENLKIDSYSEWHINTRHISIWFYTTRNAYTWRKYSADWSVIVKISRLFSDDNPIKISIRAVSPDILKVRVVQ